MNKKNQSSYIKYRSKAQFENIRRPNDESKEMPG
jgi:hypothetical protein